MTTCRKSSRPTGLITPGDEVLLVSSATLGVSMTLSTSTRKRTLKAMSIAEPSTVASTVVSFDPVSAAVAVISTLPGSSCEPGATCRRAE